jgi:hypothetical protein
VSLVAGPEKWTQIYAVIHPLAKFAGTTSRGHGSLLALKTLVSADASSHREAPLISEDPVADNTDVYAFVDSDTPGFVNLIANFQGFQKPGGGPNYFEFDDEGFFADIASIFDLGALRPILGESYEGGEGIDTFAGYNVQSIALQVPIDEVVDDDSVIGIWSTASRQTVRVFRGNNGSRPFSAGSWVQVSRLGNPLVNEVVIPLKLKDAFNSLEPEDDAETLTGVTAPPYSTEGDIPLVQNPILGFYIEALYGVDVPDAPRNDLVEIFLTGIPGTNQPEDVQPAELLRLNTDTLDSSWPNGRNVGDTALTAVGGTPLTDGANSNDVPYLDDFPYLGTPHQGTDLRNPERVVQAP